MKTNCLSVLVRAFGDEPVQLRAVRFARRSVYVVGERGGDPIGFPSDRVYEFDEERFGWLRRLHQNGDAKSLSRAWDQLSQISTFPDAPKG